LISNSIHQKIIDMPRGLAVAPGVAIGTAYCIQEVFVSPDRSHLLPSEVKPELDRFVQAVEKSKLEIQSLQNKALKQIGKSAAAIFSVQETILKDPQFLSTVHRSIESESLSAQAALAKILEFYQKLASSKSTNQSSNLLFDRLADIRDIIIRLTSHLSEALHEDTGALPGPLIVVANELLPSQSIMLGDRPIAGIVNQTGGATSHAAIIARGRGIPAVSGVQNILKQVRNGDTLVVDGSSGVVHINPGSETLTAYRKVQREYVKLKDRLAIRCNRPCQTACGVPLELLANINGVTDLAAVNEQGAGGIGLYRTEYLYLTHQDIPDEEEQFANYVDVLRRTPNHRLTIRTLDIGGDKAVPFLSRGTVESNPFMGLRSIRLSFEHPQLFLAQIRAIYRAASPRVCAGSELQILFPMIATFEELRKLRAICRKAEVSLKKDKLPFAVPKFGMMIEVPSSALMIDQLLGAVDFVSIGSNDLIQYLMAADRDNPRVNSLCDPLSPAVLRILENVIRTSQLAHRPVTLCGEMASNPAAFTILLGMGLRRFSMSPAFIPTMKELARNIHLEQCQSLLKRALRLREAKKVSKLINEYLLSTVPQLQPLLMSDS
jgi:phosphoenolpyruvate-protein phosphotransferase